MPVGFYNGLVAALLALIVTTIILLPFRRRLPWRIRAPVLGVAAITAILIERYIWPFHSGYDTRALLVGMIAGGMGGIIGGAVGLAIDKLKQGRRISYVLPLAVVGLVASEIADIGGNSASKSFVDAVLPRSVARGPGEISLAQFRKEALSGSGAVPKMFRQFKDSHPVEFDRYTEWLQSEGARAWAAGLRGDELETHIEAQSASFSERLLLAADAQTVDRVMETRLAVARKLNSSNERWCVGHTNGLNKNSPEMVSIAVDGMALIGLLLPFRDQTPIPPLPEDRFQEASEEIIARLYERYGDDALPFLGMVPLTDQNLPAFCKVQIDFFNEIARIPDDSDHLRQRYYQTLTATALAATNPG